MANGDENDKSVTFSVSMDSSTLQLLDEYVKFRKSESPESPPSRGSVLSAAFTEYIKCWAMRNLPEYRNKTVLKRAYKHLSGESC